MAARTRHKRRISGTHHRGEMYQGRLGAAIRLLRQRRRWTQAELGARARRSANATAACTASASTSPAPTRGSPCASADAFTADEIADLDGRLARLDARRPWTAQVLRLIAERPGVRAADLAAELGRERLEFKTDVRKLKALGLTESLEVGYRLSPRGRAYLGR